MSWCERRSLSARSRSPIRSSEQVDSERRAVPHEGGRCWIRTGLHALHIEHFTRLTAPTSQQPPCRLLVCCARAVRGQAAEPAAARYGARAVQTHGPCRCSALPAETGAAGGRARCGCGCDGDAQRACRPLELSSQLRLAGFHARGPEEQLTPLRRLSSDGTPPPRGMPCCLAWARRCPAASKCASCATQARTAKGHRRAAPAGGGGTRRGAACPSWRSEATHHVASPCAQQPCDSRFATTLALSTA